MRVSFVRRARRNRVAGVALAALVTIGGACTDPPAKIGDRRAEQPGGTETVGHAQALPDGWVARISPETKQRSYVRVAKAEQPPTEIAKTVNDFFTSTKNFETRWRTDRWTAEHAELLKRLKRPADSDITIDNFRRLDPPDCEIVTYLVDYPIAPCALVNVTLTTSDGNAAFPYLVLVRELGKWKVTDAVACAYLPELPCSNRQWNRK